MLIVNVINTLPNIEDRKIEDFDDFLCEIDDRKERKKRKYFSKQMCVSSKKIRMGKEEGATVAATPYLLRCDTVRAGLVRAERAAILHGDKLYRKPP